MDVPFSGLGHFPAEISDDRAVAEYTERSESCIGIRLRTVAMEESKDPSFVRDMMGHDFPTLLTRKPIAEQIESALGYTTHAASHRLDSAILPGNAVLRSSPAPCC